MNDVYAKLVSWVENITVFAYEQIPPFVQEVATYGFWEGIFLSIGSALAAILAFFTLRWCAKGFNSDSNEGTILACIVIIVVGSCSVFSHGADAIKAKCAPKLYVLERFIKK